MASKGTSFINVDLDVDSSEDLSALIDALAPNAYSLERSPGRASFELNALETTHVEGVMLEFIRIIHALPLEARGLWDRATRRAFDVGLQSQHEPFSETHTLGLPTLRAMNAIGAELAFTLYAVDPRAAPT